MKNLLTTFVIILLIASCKSPTAPDNEFQPYIVGNFKIVMPTEAEYIGEQSNQKTISATNDTIEIKQPGQRSLKLWKKDGTEQGRFEMQFVDSTMSKNDINGDIYVKFYNPKGDGGYPMGASGYGMTLDTDFIKTQLNMMYNCGSSFNATNPIIHIRYEYRDSGSHIRTYAIFVDGIMQTVEDITC